MEQIYTHAIEGGVVEIISHGKGLFNLNFISSSGCKYGHTLGEMTTLCIPEDIMTKQTPSLRRSKDGSLQLVWECAGTKICITMNHNCIICPSDRK